MTITSVVEFINALGASNKSEYVRYYRGHADHNYHIEPRIYRGPNPLVKYERDIIREVIIRSPDEFPRTASFFEQLVKLAHYGLPTRLLDLTENALVALYFACLNTKDNEKENNGQVIILNIPADKAKYYDSDTVAVVSNIARREPNFSMPVQNGMFSEPNSIVTDIGVFNSKDEILRLVHHIKEDKPGFLAQIVPQDLSQVILVKPKLDNPRIIRQAGAFLLFGMKENKNVQAEVPKEWLEEKIKIQISKEHKSDILRQLSSLGINEQFLFPELDNQTKCIEAQYKNRD